MKRHLQYLLMIPVLVSACTGDELQPAFVHIADFEVISDPGSEGSPTQKITDAWVYVNGIQLGVFELPVTVPVLDTGTVNISVFAGIKENGFSSIGNIYPFYSGFETTLTLRPFETDSIQPSVDYLSGLSWIYLERFELGNSFTQLSGSETGLEIVTDPELVLEGSRSAFANMEPGISVMKVTTGPLLFPTVGNAVWAEVDYKASVPFEVWVNGNYTGGIPISSYMLTVGARDDWNKIYLNLAAKVATLQAETYNLEFRCYKPDSVSSAELYFDNIKIIAF